MSLGPLVRWPRPMARVAGGIVFFTGTLVLVGWALNIEALKDLGSDWPRMAASTALAFVLSGFGLWWGADPQPVGQGELGKSLREYLLPACGATVALIGGLKLIEWLGGWNFGIDRLWFRDSAGLAPARMAPPTAMNFVLLGCALVLAAQKRFIGAFESVTLLGGSIGWLGLSHYLYGGAPIIPYKAMAIHTAAGFLMLSAGLFCLRTDGGLMALLVSPNLGGAIARRLTPAVVVLPIVFGWLCLQAQRAGWIGTEAVVPVFAQVNVLVFGGLVLANAGLLQRSDSRRRQAEQQILSLNAELERRVEERTAELAAANREMEAFTYSVAHDLRAPLRHIDAFSKILEKDFGATLPPEAERCLASIRKANATMSQLVEALLELARLAQHELKCKAVPLGPGVEKITAGLKREIEGRQIEWRIQPLPVVECDPTLVNQAFGNLLANAVKFTRTRAQAVIEVGHISHSGQDVFFVRDNGVGFDMAHADKLFGLFQRLHHVEFEGAGTGLAAVERIVRKHGGRIWVEAALDKGATFYFTLGAGKEGPKATL